MTILIDPAYLLAGPWFPCQPFHPRMGLPTWDHGTNRGGNPAFATTHWSAVVRAGHDGGADGHAALETFCRSYWYPLYAYIRRLGHSAHDAQDLTQSFLAYVLDKKLIARADRDLGHFCSFLLGSLRYFMANDWRRRNTEVRGGGCAMVSLDAISGEARYAREPADTESPESLFEQTRAIAVLDQAIRQLESEHAAAGKQPLFEALYIFLQGERGSRSYAEIGAQLSMSEAAVKVAVHRLRRRCRELLRAAVADIVSGPLEVEDELRHLMRVLSR
jgi:RNA polymerase sigma-70 factor (ECF subfamily)